MSLPIATYVDLQAAILAAIDTSNSEIASQVTTFIFVTEQVLNRRFVPPAAWSRRYHTINSQSATARFLTLPPETTRVTRLHFDTPPYSPLKQMTPSQLMREYPQFETGQAKAFAILGEVLEFSHVPDQDYTVEIVSRQRIWPLGKDLTDIGIEEYQSHVENINDEVAANYWLVHAADVLFHGALLRAARVMRDTEETKNQKIDFELALEGFERYTAAKALTENQGASAPEGVMIV